MYIIIITICLFVWGGGGGRGGYVTLAFRRSTT